MGGRHDPTQIGRLASLFDHLLESNAIAGGNPVHGVKRPKIESNEGKTPALGDHQAKALLEAPDKTTLKGLRDRALLAVLIYHGLRRQETALLQVSDIQERRGIQHLKVHGKGGKVRYLPMHPVAAGRIHQYLESSGHHVADRKVPLFIPRRGRLTGHGQWHLHRGGGLSEKGRDSGRRPGGALTQSHRSHQCLGA
ncbi:Phage integrase [Pseudomonas savastanoi pv. glycinea]|nr:Phage integrase [Pseudomonas savastanoi pv. glycinea]